MSRIVFGTTIFSARGCREADLPKSGGAGLFYCFAVE